MLALYILAAIVGGGLILFSALGGVFGHDADTGTDHSADHSADHSPDHSPDHHHDAPHTDGPWLPFFSLRFWTYAIGAFGLMGVALDLFTQAAEPLLAGVAAGSGLAMGLVAAYFLEFLRRQQSPGIAAQDDFIGTEARVSVAARGLEPGKIRVEVRGELIDLLARAESGRDLEVGEQVVVVGIDGNIVRVSTRNELFGPE